jgi:nitrite reductase/ring-hydroxylating ferredoxin subunit/DMSO/TMAO reductase YedYZ heme-binding membrane subunit
MSERYRAISWNRQKKIYDAVLWTSVAIYLGSFVGVGAALDPNATAETLLIRGLGTCAFILLHVALLIGPLSRFAPKLLPLLYNRRHLGVTTFFVGAAHGILSIVQFHAFGDLNPLVSVLVSNTRFGSVPDFPFQQLGLGALVVLFLMAVTSHDFWLRNLTPSVWKTLHLLVYAAYAMLVAHVALGVLQAERSPGLVFFVGAGAFAVIAAHVAAAIKETPADRETDGDEWADVCAIDEIPENRARIRTVGGERVAVFRYDGRISALSNVCRHQGGPLGEGKIVDGCVTCPWHGFQYLPETGASPPPFTEKVGTYDVRIIDGRVQVRREANAPGTRVEPAKI